MAKYLLIIFLLVSPHSLSFTEAKISPYQSDNHNKIKSLSQQQVSGLLAGKGIGLAKTVELNSYPGPMHVLELAEPLALSDEQKKQSQVLMKNVKQTARELGSQIVALSMRRIKAIYYPL